MAQKLPQPGIVPLAIRIQTEIRALTDINAQDFAYPHVVGDLLPRCGGSRSTLDRVLRHVRDLTHTAEFIHPRTKAIVNNHRRMPGYAVPPVTPDTQGRLIMSRGLDHLAFGMICATVRSSNYTMTRGFNLTEQVENIMALVPTTMRRERTALRQAIGRMHSMFDPFTVSIGNGGELSIVVRLLRTCSTTSTPSKRRTSMS